MSELMQTTILIAGVLALGLGGYLVLPKGEEVDEVWDFIKGLFK